MTSRIQIGILLKPWFLLFVFVGLAHQFLQKVLELNLPIADAYLDPLLLLPIVLQLMLWERRVIFRAPPDYELEWWRVAALFLIVSVVAEIAFPLLSNKFTADPYDVVCYGLGAGLYYWIRKIRLHPIIPPAAR